MQGSNSINALSSPAWKCAEVQRDWPNKYSGSLSRGGLCAHISHSMNQGVLKTLGGPVPPVVFSNPCMNGAKGL